MATRCDTCRFYNPHDPSRAFVLKDGRCKIALPPWLPWLGPRDVNRNQSCDLHQLPSPALAAGEGARRADEGGVAP